MAEQQQQTRESGGSGSAGPPERLLEQELLHLKKQHQLQHQILLQSFQQQQQHLTEQHEQQLRQHLKEFWEQQKHLQEIREREQLEALRKKEKHEESAIASTEVKQKLQAFLRQRTSGCSVVGNSQVGNHHSTQENSWSEGMDTSSDQSSTNDFPLRKTASEPNLLKVRLKQRVMERRSSPMSKRHLPPSSLKKKLLISSNNCQPPGGSGGSPPSSTTATATSNHNNSSPSTITTVAQLHLQQQQQQLQQQQQQLLQQVPPPSAKELSPPCCDTDEYHARHALFSSPSMPNISLAAHHQHVLTSPDLSEAAMRAACTARLGMPLTGQMLTGPLPFYPSLPAIDSAEHEEAATLDTISELQEPATLTHHHQQHHHYQTRGVIRPLGRTQSSPLPLGHPLLDGGGGGGPAAPGGDVVSIPGQLVVTTGAVQLRLAAQAAVELVPEEREQEQRDLELRAAESRSIRPLSRAVSSPVVHLGTGTVTSSGTGNSAIPLTRRRASSATNPTTGIAYDSLMLKHACQCGNNGPHPEHAGRLQSIWARLLETGLVNRCDRLRPRKASTQELQTCHSETHVLLYGTSPMNRHKMDMSKLNDLPVTAFMRLPCGGIGVDTDTTWSDCHTAPAARMAVGCTIDLAFRTWTGDIRNGFAIVRPPGHHAEPSQARGFCFFNSVAIAARLLQKEHRVHKILIFDWDVHHGNGTQDIFYDDPRVLVISMHRHDDGNFFPGTGNPDECGTGAGLGFNVNIAWCGGLNPPLGDAEYLAAFRTIVAPITREFAPDIILVSAGFDGADGHAPQLGGYRLTPACFGHMTRSLMHLANGRVVLALEGGYDLPSICDSAEECVRVLLGDQPTAISTTELNRVPCANAVRAMHQVLSVQSQHWPCLLGTEKTVTCSYQEVLRSERDDKETVTAMASLSMQHHMLRAGGGGGYHPSVTSPERQRLS